MIIFSCFSFFLPFVYFLLNSILCLFYIVLFLFILLSCKHPLCRMDTSSLSHTHCKHCKRLPVICLCFLSGILRSKRFLIMIRSILSICYGLCFFYEVFAFGRSQRFSSRSFII